MELGSLQYQVGGTTKHRLLWNHQEYGTSQGILVRYGTRWYEYSYKLETLCCLPARYGTVRVLYSYEYKLIKATVPYEYCRDQRNTIAASLLLDTLAGLPWRPCWGGLL